jgi:hypothetical protein
MSNAGAAQVARRRAFPALCENATRKLLVKETMAILVTCVAWTVVGWKKGKLLAFRVEVE